MDKLDNLDKIKSYFSRGDNGSSTTPRKRRRRQEPGHEDHGSTSNNIMLFPLIVNNPGENNYDNNNEFHSARNNSMAQGLKSGSHTKGYLGDILQHYHHHYGNHDTMDEVNDFLAPDITDKGLGNTKGLGS